MKDHYFEDEEIVTKDITIVKNKSDIVDKDIIRENYDIRKNRSEVVREILNDIPSKIIRYGIMVILMIAILFFICSYFIKYPDAITAEVELNAQTPPVNMVARASGKIKLLIKDRDSVKKGQYLGWITNTSKPEDLFYILKNIENIKTNIYKNDTISYYEMAKGLELGSIQDSYLNLLRGIESYNDYLNLDPEGAQIVDFKNRFGLYIDLKHQIEIEKRIMVKEKDLVNKNYQRNKKLWNKGVISKAEYEKSRLEYLNFNRSFEANSNNSINNDLQINELQSSINLLKIRRNEQFILRKEAIITLFKQFQNELRNLENNFLLKSPIDGKVSFFNIWADNQNVNLGDEVMTIVPKSENIFGFIKTPIRGSGNIRTDQKVNIKFHEYPAIEYGQVFAKVKSVSLMSKEDFYNIKIDLPDGLKTSYKKRLEFRPGMKGTAKIITKDKRLIERIFNNFKELFDKMK